MARSDARRRELRHAARGAAIALVLYSVVAGALIQMRGPISTQSARFVALESSRPADFGSEARGRSKGHSANPQALIVWRLGIYAPVERMGLESDGTLEVPSDAQEAGWFARGPRPGENGSAVIVGHYDSRTGPGIFWPLKKLRVGDEVGVVDRRGNEFVFQIVRIEQVDKDLFPTRSVYGPTSKPTLKLITCKGDIDPGTGHYADNLIAYGKLAG